MKITCPTCHASYIVPNDKIPSDRKVKATCKKCGDKIDIAPKEDEVELKETEVEKGEAVKLSEKLTDETTKSPTAHEIKKTSVLMLIVLTIITLGIYIPIWFLIRRQDLNKLNSEKKLGSGIFVFITVFNVFYILISFAIGFSEGYSGQPNQTLLGLNAIANIVNIICTIILVVKSFTVRRMLSDHFQKPLSGVATFFLTIYYLQYKINRF